MAKRGTFEHPKTLMLASALGIEPYAVVGLLESLWHWTAKYGPDGVIGGYSNQIIVAGIGWRGDADMLIEQLIKHEWLDALDDDRRLAIHDWADHIDNTTKKFLERHKKTAYKSEPGAQSQVQILESSSDVQKNGPKNGGDVQTLPQENGLKSEGHVQKNGQKTGGHVQPHARLNQTIPNQTIPNPGASTVEIERTNFDDAWDKFQKIYPKRKGENSMDRARKELTRLYLASQDLEEILDGVGRYAEYVRMKPVEPGFVISAYNFLDRRHWLDPHDLPEPEPDHREIGRKPIGIVTDARKGPPQRVIS